MRKNLLISLLLGVLIALAAWPVYVFVNVAINYFSGEASVIDLWVQEPKRNLIQSFVEGYKASAIIAVCLGVVAAADYAIFTSNRLLGYIAGITVPAFCIGLAFIYHVNPIQVMLGFALTGVLLWVLYKLVDIGFRLRRTA